MTLLLISGGILLYLSLVKAISDDLTAYKVRKAVAKAAKIEHLLGEAARYRDLYARCLKTENIELQLQCKALLLETETELLAYEKSIQKYSLLQAFSSVRRNLMEELLQIRLAKNYAAA